MNYDLAILGAGPAGYVAAHKAGKAGMSVLMITEEEVGGVCLNAGCIPTKTLLYSAKNYQNLKSGHIHGLGPIDQGFSMKEALKWKEEVIKTYRKGIMGLFSSVKVTFVQGRGVLRDRSTIEVDGTQYTANHILICTGSRAAVPPIPGLTESDKVITSTEALELEELPESLCIIGSGVIGLEFASLYSMLGVKVTVIEMLEDIALFLEPEVRKIMKRNLGSVSFKLSSQVTSIEDGTVCYTRKGKKERISADRILVAVGRKANIEGIGLKEAGVKTSAGYILVNERMETSAPRVYAAGDVVGKSLFAHSASRMAEVAVDVMLGDRAKEMDYRAIPWAVYTWPEAAGCGLSEKDAKAEGYEVVTSSVPMRLSARYFAEQENTPSVVKLIADAKSRRLLGLQMIGSGASEMLWGATLAITNSLTVEEIAQTIFAHPTVSEVISDALKGL